MGVRTHKTVRTVRSVSVRLKTHLCVKRTNSSNSFVKPNEQKGARTHYAMARN